MDTSPKHFQWFDELDEDHLSSGVNQEVPKLSGHRIKQKITEGEQGCLPFANSMSALSSKISGMVQSSASALQEHKDSHNYESSIP